MIEPHPDQPFVSIVLDKQGNRFTERHAQFDEAQDTLIKLKDTIPNIKELGIIHYRNWDNRGPRVKEVHKYCYEPARPEVFIKQSPVEHYRWNTWENISWNFLAPGCFMIFALALLGLFHLVRIFFFG